MPPSLNESLFKTFEDLAEHVLQKILRLLNNQDIGIDCVTVFFDCYKDAIKAMEHHRRGAGETTASHQVISRRDVQNYWMFLKGAANKGALAAFVCESMTAKASAVLQQNKSTALAGGFADSQLV